MKIVHLIRLVSLKNVSIHVQGQNVAEMHNVRFTTIEPNVPVKKGFKEIHMSVVSLLAAKEIQIARTQRDVTKDHRIVFNFAKEDPVLKEPIVLQGTIGTCVPAPCLAKEMVTHTVFNVRYIGYVLLCDINSYLFNSTKFR